MPPYNDDETKKFLAGKISELSDAVKENTKDTKNEFKEVNKSINNVTIAVSKLEVNQSNTCESVNKMGDKLEELGEAFLLQKGECSSKFVLLDEKHKVCIDAIQLLQRKNGIKKSKEWEKGTGYWAMVVMIIVALVGGAATVLAAIF